MSRDVMHKQVSHKTPCHVTHARLDNTSRDTHSEVETAHSAWRDARTGTPQDTISRDTHANRHHVTYANYMPYMAVCWTLNEGDAVQVMLWNTTSSISCDPQLVTCPCIVNPNVTDFYSGPISSHDSIVLLKYSWQPVLVDDIGYSYQWPVYIWCTNLGYMIRSSKVLVVSK